MSRFEIDRRRRGFSYWTASAIIAALASILPSYAVNKASQTIESKYIVLYLSLISTFTAYSYWADKRKAKRDLWRTPESSLHLLEFAGGWVAAFFSQRIFRHKVSKKDYQTGFWGIAVIHQYASFDFMNEWRYTQAVFKFIEPILK